MQAPLTLFVWSANRIVPVRITDFSITEEAFDPPLNPIRAKVSLGMRVLSDRRSGLQRQGRQPLHGLSAAEGGARAASIRAARSARSASGHSMSDSLADRSRAGAAGADVAARNLFPPPAATTASARPRLSGRTARRSSTCGAASCRAGSLPADPGAHRRRRAIGSTTSRARISAIRSCSGASCDANGAMQPDELTETVGRRLRITLPEGITGAVAVNRGFYLTLMMGSVHREPGAAAGASTR